MTLDWGDVPTWLTAGSILIGVEELRRRRMDDERQQVDQVSLWCEPGSTVSGSPSPAVLHIANAAATPARVLSVGVLVTDQDKRGLEQLQPLRSAVTLESGGRVAHPLALPGTGASPTAQPVLTWIAWALVIDNAGRVWRTRHSRGRRAKRLRWWSRDRLLYPYEWTYPAPVAWLDARVPAFHSYLRRRDPHLE